MKTTVVLHVAASIAELTITSKRKAVLESLHLSEVIERASGRTKVRFTRKVAVPCVCSVQAWKRVVY